MFEREIKCNTLKFAELSGKSNERIRQIENRAIKFLKHPVSINKLLAAMDNLNKKGRIRLISEYPQL